MNDNSPYQVHIDAGRFKVIEKPVRMVKTVNKTQTLVTPKRVDYIARLITSNEMPVRARALKTV